MHRFPVYLLAGLVSLLGPMPLAQAQQSCPDRLQNDRAALSWYPQQPLAPQVATGSIERVLDELRAIATAPSSGRDSANQRLYTMLMSFSNVRPPDSPRIAQVEQVLNQLNPNNPRRVSAQQRAEAIAALEQIFPLLLTKLEQDATIPYRDQLTAQVAKYYQQMAQLSAPTQPIKPDPRAAEALRRGLAAQLQSAQPEQNSSPNIAWPSLLQMALQLNQGGAVAPLLPQLEAALSQVPGQPMQPQALLKLGQAYQAAGQSAKALALLDRYAKTLAKEAQQPELAATYVKLKRLDRAKPHLDVILKGYIFQDEAAYGRLAIAYQQANQPAIAQQLLAKIWGSLRNDVVDNETPFLQDYFQAGGQPEPMFQLLLKAPQQRQFDHLLRVAGEFRRQNQPQRSAQAIEQFLKLWSSWGIQQREIEYHLWFQAREGYSLESQIVLDRLLNRGQVRGNTSYLVDLANLVNRLDQVEPLFQRLLKSNPELRIELLQETAIAYAQQNRTDKAIYIAQRLPRKTPSESTAIVTLTQIATTLHQQGYRDQAQSVLAQTTAIAAGIRELDARAQAYGSIAVAQVLTGQTQAAETSRQTAVQWAKQQPAYPEAALSWLSQKFLDQKLLDLGWKTFQDIPAAKLKETNIDTLLNTALETGNLAIAQQALDLIAQHHPPRSYLTVAPRLASHYLGLGQPAPAKEILTRMQTMMNQLPPDQRSVQDLRQILPLLAQTGAIAQAQALIDQYLGSAPPANYRYEKSELQAHLNCYK